MEVTSRSSGRGGDRTRSSLAAAVAEAASARASGRASSNARAPTVPPPADTADSADLMDESANARLLGARRGGSSSSGPPLGAPPPPPPSRDAPMTDEAHAVRLNVLNSSVQEAREARNSRLIIWGLTLVNAPQVVAAATVMALKWREQTLCYRIQVWVLVHTAHLAVTLALEWAAYYLNRSRSNRAIHWRERYMGYLSQLKYGLDLAGLFWFLVGNMWVISDGARCDDGSAMYQLALWMIIIAYAKIFLPCLLLLLLLPVICFCLPCVIRLLSRLQDPMRGKGATKEAIDRLETKKFAPHMFADEDSTCCICLNDYEAHQDLRVLPCEHHFHKECVDEWLVVNSTCPTCRTSIFGVSDDAHGDAGRMNTEEGVMRIV